MLKKLKEELKKINILSKLVVMSVWVEMNSSISIIDKYKVDDIIHNEVEFYKIWDLYKVRKTTMKLEKDFPTDIGKRLNKCIK